MVDTITIAKKGNQVERIMSGFEDSFKKQDFDIIKVETEFKTEKEKNDAWMKRFGN